jgi:hypothetical protein
VSITIKIPDAVIILLALGLIGFSASAAYIGPQNARQVLIQGQDRQWVFPLDAEETLRVKGPLGDTVLQIRENRAWVESSPCSNQSCVAMGQISSSGNWVACLPNNVFLIIEGKNEGTINEPDSIAW